VPRIRPNPILARLFADYGMLVVLLVICLYYSWATFRLQDPKGEAAGRVVARQVLRSVDKDSGDAGVLVLAGEGQEETKFAATLEAALTESGYSIVEKFQGDPPGAARTINRLVRTRTPIGCIAASKSFELVIEKRQQSLPELARVPVVFPEQYWWPTFLNYENLINVANQIAVYAIIAIGMTMVIITGGIDLCVGSLVALSAVIAANLIVRMGAESATAAVMVLACAAAVLMSAAVGAFCGAVITVFKTPPFIATLAIMLSARGLALQIAGGQSIYELPQSFSTLGGGSLLLKPFGYAFPVPYPVLLMLGLYVVAHLVMSRTTFGRHIYAVGGNRQAARLSGIRVNRVLLAVYVISGAMAGLGGIIQASRVRSGDPNLGPMYELYVIAAVVVGGTSLNGGEGRMLGTLIGAFVIAVILNGMNLTQVEPYTQNIVLGMVILGAVVLDQLRKNRWRLPSE
jgi:ribose transport system permease protein